MNKFDFFVGDSLNPEWVGDKIRAFANQLSGRKGSLSGTQLRAFYNEFLRIRDLTADASEKLILIKLLSAKINYRRTAKASDIPEEMVDFVTELVEQIGQSELRFKQACYLMEAFVGFFPKKN